MSTQYSLLTTTQRATIEPKRTIPQNEYVQSKLRTKSRLA